ncbi:SET domain-containing protein [Coprinopsis marcescibilis]|uniref:Histone-lysine N-methyltransferase SET5 n=1 Tax=Coprinopsis marcescibilis TaxID=230819 RepID=A0A5C3KJZ8_COPMA|nr:SET domain-containing protein [Coprinopsis marcescibilis]
MPIPPAEDVLTRKIVDLKTQNPTLGIAKIHALLLKECPDWLVSEKRTKKILQNEGLTAIANKPGSQPAAHHVHPTSRLIPNLDMSKWTSKVRVKMFDKVKGKGLVSAVDMQEGDLIWKEDPFIVAPEWEIYDLVESGKACALCTTPFSPDSPLIINCPASTSSCRCPARFCNRLCVARSAKVHPLLCPAQNPASVPLMRFARDNQWMALGALIHCISRVLLAHQHKDAKADLDIMRSFASLGMEERAKYDFNIREPDRQTWKKAHHLVVQAFKEPKTPNEQKKLGKILKKPLDEDIDQEFFNYDPGFLRNLGKMSLNLEAHGGLYILHSHLNHSCLPNVSVRHNDKRTALSRISLITKRPISIGDELTISYVNPDLPYKMRQEQIRQWGFGPCKCERCVSEERLFQLKDVLEESNLDMDDIARELKAGLGVM